MLLSQPLHFAAYARTDASVVAALYRRRSRWTTLLSPSWALRWTRGSLASLSASLRTFGFLSTLAAPWRSLAKRPPWSPFSPFFLLNKGCSSSLFSVFC
jgi:hypothetical protein